MTHDELVEKVDHGDRTKAEALRIAYDRLTKLGWSFTHRDVGRVAKEILNELAASPLGSTALRERNEAATP